MKRRTLKSRLLAFLLVLCMVVGLTPVYAVSDGEYETLELDVPKLVAVEAGETVTYKFIPEETGEYVVLGWYEMGSPRELIVEGPNASCKEMKNSAYRCSLTAGEEYTFSFINNEYNFETREVTVTTLVQPEGLTILGGEESIELYAGEMCAFSATTFPENAAPQRGTIWTCSDGSEYEGRYYFSSWYNTGTFVLTATAIDDPTLTDSITVVVKQRKKVNMSVGETVELTLEPGESAEITCEVEEAGNYIFYQPKGEYQFEIDHYPGDWENDAYVGQVFESTEGKPITIRLSCSEWCESAVTRSITIVKGTKTEGIEIVGEDAGLVGQTREYSIRTTPEFGVSDRDCKWTVSDESIAELAWYNTTYCSLTFKAAGTVTLTATSESNPDLTASFEITVEEPDQIALDEAKLVDLEAGETVAYTFVPAESGDYIVHYSNEVGWLGTQMYGNHSGDLELITETRVGRIYYDLIAGENYLLEVTCPEWAEKLESVEIVLTKSAKTEGFTIRGDTTGLVDRNVDFQLQFTPEFGVSDDITWSVSDESIAEIVWNTNTFCNLYLKAAGTVTLTATSVQDPTKTASVEITVEEPKYIQVGETVEVNLQPGEMTAYNFSANGKAGYYMFMIPRDAMCGFGRYGDFYEEFWNWTEEYECLIVAMPEDGHMTIELYGPEDRPEPVSTTLTVVEAVEATDISFAGGDTVEIGVGEQVRIPFDLVDGNYIRDLNFEFVSDNCCVEVHDFGSGFINLYGFEPGTTTIAFMSNGIYKELTVNVLPYGHDIADENKWIGTAEDMEIITVEYTPEKDGFYFFHHQDLPSLVPAKDSAQPLADFWHNEYGVWGHVYQLEGGKTYTFVSEHEWIGDYAYFVKEIFMAEDFEIVSAINGMVNERYTLWIEADGVVNPTYKSSNENVVLLGGGGSDGVQLFLVGEGTAEIIVTNANGKEKVCTVTVSGKAPVQEFYDYVEFGLAAGGSVTYSYTPWESGLYWFRIDENAGVNVSVALNGEPVAYKYDMGTEGVVYELTAETEYMVTVTGAEPVVSYLFASLVQEATHLELEAERMQVYEGVENTLWYGLRDDDGYLAAADVTVKSSDESVLQITSYSNEIIWFNPVAAGTATITVTTHNGLTDSVEVTVIEKPTLELNEVVKETLKPQEGCQWFFVAEKSGDYEITVTTNGYSVFATQSWDDEVGSTYLEKEFEGPATFTHKHHMEAGELWTYVVYNLGEEATVEATMNLKLMEVVTVVSPEDIEEAAKADEVVIDVSDTGAAKVELPVDALETLVEAEKPLTLVTGDTTVTLDAAALAAVSENANGKDITVRVEQIETETLNKKQQEAVADREVLVAISANIFAGDEYVGDFKGGKATVKVPATLEEGEKAEDYTVFFLDDEGKLTPVETFVKNGDIYFVTGHFSEYVILKNAPVDNDPVAPGTGADPDKPNTGDDANLAMMTALLLVSMIGMAFIVVNGKKNSYVGKWER